MVSRRKLREGIGAVGLALLTLGCVHCDDPAASCEAIAAQAHQLMEEAGQCTTESGCVVVAMSDLGGGGCLGAFQCSAALGEDVDQASVAEEIAGLRSAYQGCAICVSADCVPNQELEASCDEATQRCELRLIGSPGGG